MFTTIANLRKSHAQQGRVSTVEGWLKRQNSAWTPESKFPIAFIAHSNSVDDVDWVNGNQGTHASWPELANEVLKEFGHKTQGEHRDAIESMLRTSAGKTKVLAEEIVPKYNAAFARLGAADFGSVFWPFSVVRNVVNATAETPASAPLEAVETISGAEKAAIDGHDISSNANEDAPNEDAPQAETASVAFDNSVSGAMYIGLGKVMVSKNKTLNEAAKYSISPTGGRLFSDYVETFVSGVDVKTVRACLKAFVADIA